MSKHPTKCLVPKGLVTPQTVYFAGRPISLSAIASSVTPALDHSYLSRIFSGDRTPATAYARVLARLIGMDFAPFLEALEQVQEASDLALDTQTDLPVSSSPS